MLERLILNAGVLIMTKITEHKWSDGNVNQGAHCFSKNDLWFSPHNGHMLINESDAIAIAKHFNIKEADYVNSRES